MRIIGFSGVQCEDIMLHFGKTAELAGNRVGLVPGRNSLEKAELTLLGSISEAYETEDAFDLLLVFAGFDVNRMDKCDDLVIVVDRCPLNAGRMAEKLRIRERNSRTVVFVRDTIVQEYDDGYIMKMLGIRDECISVPWSENDLRLRCRIQNGFMYSLAEMSGEMKAGVIRLFARLGLGSEKEAELAVRKEKKNKWESLLPFGHRSAAVM